ncbi:TIGR02680 family protein [Oceanobacillus halophilus]|uniref:TIGR02680 family protein n=1 Tax=Oceanobacillus halophilus TaxID=930130 RepID=A0A495ABQ3_9BACI|nr:TIGR02680 family protein [Oceanobacillus halophilus]RKQ35846.1 TIGR02680 family protein [Oceanobacillus halophilus]
MNKANKWKMNRAGLLNFWYYDDEIFDFADGKLLLRGSNGSGKSVTMQSILPVLLDGKKSPDRLDPFGSKARKMEDYLLGEKEVSNRDERTGYLFLEYKREDTNQYITTGIGLQARRHKTMNAWYFIITDNRRIGKDIFLYEMEKNAGQEQKIPLSRIQLENRIGSGGQVVRTQKEYMKLVNKYVFGFVDMDSYEDLIKLLIQLRSPKLSKDFKPTVIYEILEAALPPLTDDDLRHLSDTIEHMDQTKQQIEQLERENTAITKLIKRYDVYNQYSIADKAKEYLTVKKRLDKEEKGKKASLAEQEERKQELEQLKDRNVQLEQDMEVLEQKSNRLQKHKVWDLEEELTKLMDNLKTVTNDIQDKDTKLTSKKQKEIDTKKELDILEAAISENEQDMEDTLLDLQADAEEASFGCHRINEEDFYRNATDNFDFEVWNREADNHFKNLETITNELGVFEQLKTQVTNLQNKIGTIRMEVDQEKAELEDWSKIFEKDKQAKVEQIYRWKDNYSFIHMDETVLQQVSRKMDQLYEPYTYEAIRSPFLEQNNEYQMQTNEKIATERSKVTIVETKISEKEAELLELKQRKDPEPPNQQEATREARSMLRENGHAFLPFYEAVEFQEHVPEEVRQQIEAILLDTGTLNALITEKEIPVRHDRIIQPKPNMMAHTLADYLHPDVEENSAVSAITVDEVLQSILVNDAMEAESGMQIQEDGTYYMGLLSGHAVPIERVRFIGKNARKRYREEQIRQLQEEIAQLQEEKQEILARIDRLQEKIQEAKAAISHFPDDTDLSESFHQMKEKRFKMERLEKEIQKINEELEEAINNYQMVKRTLDTRTRDLNIEFTKEAYQKARDAMRMYEKTLGDLRNRYTAYLHQKRNMQIFQQQLEELLTEIMDVTGELNVLSDRKTKLEAHREEIEKQMAAHGVEDIRKQIQEVQRSLQVTKEELQEITKRIPKIESDLERITEQISQQKRKVTFFRQLLKAWSEAVTKELSYGFIFIPEEMDREQAEECAKWIYKEFKQILDEKDSSKVEAQLTNVFYEQQSDLMEYRMTETQDSMVAFNWEMEDWTDEEIIQMENLRKKVSRRMIHLDFQGKRVSPYYVKEQIEKDKLTQQNLLDDQDRQLYEDILFDSIGRKLRSRIRRAQIWTEKMDKLMRESDSSSGLSFSIRWKPRTAETEAEMDTKELVDLLQLDSRLLKEEDVKQVTEHFRSKITRAKEMVELKGEGSTLIQVLKEVLDYRYWFSFVLSFKRTGEPKRELTNHAFYQFSGGEKAMAMYIPLFTACYSRYSEADKTAPYIISLDEAFAGVDEDNISVMFRIVEELGFDYMMNSQVLWGDYETISSLSICELVRPKNGNFVTVIRYHWNGNQRSLLVNEKDKITE